MRITARRWPAQRRACSRINQSSRHLMLVAKPRNRKWRLILRTCCPPPAAALRAAYARCARVFSLFFCLFHSVILPKKCLYFESAFVVNSTNPTVLCVYFCLAGPQAEILQNLTGPCPAPTYLPTYLPYLWETKKEITRSVKVGYYTN